MNEFDELLSDLESTLNSSVRTSLKEREPEKEKQNEIIKEKIIEEIKEDEIIEPEVEEIIFEESKEIKDLKEQKTIRNLNLKDLKEFKEQKEKEFKEAREAKESKELETHTDFLQALGGSASDLDLDYDNIDFEQPKNKKRINNNKRKKNNKKSKSNQDNLYRAYAGEYNKPEQEKEIFKGFQKIYINELIRLIACGVFFLALVYLEIAPYINALKLPYYLNYYKAVYVMIDLQFLLLAAYISRGALIYGFKAIARNEMSLYSMVAAFFGFSAVHTLASYFLKFSGSAVLFNSAAVLAMIACCAYNILDINFDISGFQTIASKKTKFALALDNQAPPERELFREYIPHDTVVARLEKTKFISNFFKRSTRYKNNGEYSGHYIYITGIGAIIMLIIFLAFNRGIYNSLTSAAFLFLGSAPLCSFISSAYPAFKAQRKAKDSGAAFIGEHSIDESANLSIISLADKDIFPPSSVNINGIKVYGNNRIDVVIGQLCLLFSKLNLTAAQKFRESAQWDNAKIEREKIYFKEIAKNGIKFEINAPDGLSSLNLFAGKPEYIENLKLTVPVDPEYDEQFILTGGSIMLLADKSAVIAKIYLKYELSSDFQEILKNIKSIGACLAIKTLDPNIDDTILSKHINLKKYNVKILKMHSERDKYKMVESSETGIVAKENLIAAIRAIFIANRTKHVIKGNEFAQNLALAFSLILTFALTCFSPAVYINAGIILLLQIFWTVPIIFLSGFTQ